jgi:general secretion pathway protein F
MPRFAYEAVDIRGRKVTDSAEAKDKETLLFALESQGLVLLRWLDSDHHTTKFFSTRHSRLLTSNELLQFTKDLGYLLKSGLPLDRALKVIGRSVNKGNLKSLAQEFEDALRGGKSLSDAMASRQKDFGELYVNMVRVGEVGGVLPDVMEKLAQFQERAEETKKFVISSAIYPSILLMVGILSVLVIMGFVVPRFADIFRGLGQKIPFATQALISVSALLQQWWWVLLIIMIILFLCLRYVAHTSAGRLKIDKLAIRLPVVGALIREIQVSHFARTLGTLIISGVPLLKSLTIVREVVRNQIIKASVQRIYEKVKEGKKISSLMKEVKIFPEMAVQLVSVGEETGRMGEMLVEIAEELDNKIQGKIKFYLTLLEPLTILFMGLIIGGIVVSMLMAVFGINEIQF